MCSSDLSRVIVRLRDAYGNTVSGVGVKVFSSRNTDAIVARGISDNRGEVLVKIRSTNPGVSTISVLAGDLLIFEKPQIVFFLPDSDLLGVGSGGEVGQFLKAQIFGDESTQSTAYFMIENVASEVTADTVLTFRVVSKDEHGDIVKNHAGTVRFSSSDDRATLPNDYEFTPEDQGEHTFYLAVAFGTPGSQTLAVHDLNDFRISGERKVNVSLGAGAVEIPEEPGIRILAPANGSTFSSSRVTISGDAVGCDVVKLVDGSIVLIENLSVDTSRSYVYQTPSLADGTHVFQAICAVDTSMVSNEDQIQIDRTPPEVMSVEINPPGAVEPNQEFQIKIGAAESLSAVRVVFNELLTELDAVDDRNFVTTLRAPAACGEYPMSSTIVDLLGNELEESNAAVVTVCPPKASKEEVVESINIVPTAISNLSAEGGEKKVTLLWSPARDDKGIKNYQINFALCGGDLTGVNSTPDNRTQWYVDNLEPCEKYCFQVTPFDTDEAEGQISNVAEGTPFCKKPPEIIPPVTGSDTSVAVILLALLAGFGVVVLVQRRRQNG